MIRLLMTGTAALGLILAAAAAGGATAQTRAAPSNQPIMIGADTGEYTDGGFALRGRAEVMQGDNRLRADVIDGTNSGGGISQVAASGNVYYVTPTETIRGDRAVYTVSNANIVVTGDVILTQGRNVLTGGRLTYNIDTGAARMEGAASGSAGRRIQGVFYPQGTGG